MQIGTSTSLFYDQSASAMNALSAQAAQLNTEISTNSKVNAPSDDPLAWSQLQNIAQQNADGTAYASNVSLAQSLLQQSDTTLGNISTQLQQAQTLAVQAGSGTMTDTDRQNIATQLQSVLDQLVGLANTTDARGQPLYAGATGDSAVTVNTDGSVGFTGTGDPASMPIGDNQQIQPTDSAQHVFTVTRSDGTTTDIFSVVSTLMNALKTGGSGVTAAIGQATDDLKASITQIGTAQASVGAREARLNLQSTQLTSAATDREATRSSLQDPDVTTVVTNLQKISTALSAAQASFTKLSGLSLFDYLK
jgi:flagellar hook-associated protein 3 FlgL